MATLEQYTRHGIWSDPGDHRAAVATLPDDLPSLIEAVRGLFVHTDYLHLYDVSAEEFPDLSRETKSLSMRLSQILSLDDAPLSQARPPRLRAVGTCRDYALMLCGFLREKGVPARVRCGFARYFIEGYHQDHWVCEYWYADLARWSLADAQLDEVTCSELGIDFDTSALPEGRFLTSDEAWKAWYSGLMIGAAFGHGADDGAWFLVVNLARDLFSLHKQEVTEWDGWRAAAREMRKRMPEDVEVYDGIADLIASIDKHDEALDRLPEATRQALRPFWVTSFA